MNFINDVSDEEKHSASHVLAAAVKKIFPSAKIGIGPVTREGFYYDFDLKRDLTEKDILKIETKINEIVQSNQRFIQIIMPRDQAINLMLQSGQIYKAELINSIPDPEISFFKLGEIFLDLCRGPHVATTNILGPIKITKLETTNWNNDPQRPKLQRVYGMVFKNIDLMNKYFETQKEIKNSNYVKNLKEKSLGQEIDKTMFLNIQGTKTIERILYFFNKKLIQNSYENVFTSYSFFENLEEIVNTSNSFYKLKNISYKELPLKITFRGTLKNGLEVPEGFENSFDFGISFADFNNMSSESVFANIEMILEALEAIGINDIIAKIESKDPGDYITEQLSGILQKKGVSHDKIVDSKATKVFLKILGRDKYGRNWEILQAKLNPKNKNLIFFTEKNQKDEIFSFIGFLSVTTIIKLLIESNNGVIPNIVAPIQALCIPLKKEYHNFAKEIDSLLKEHGINSCIDYSSNSLKHKIQRAEKRSIPVTLVIGDQELQSRSVSLRSDKKNQGLVSLDILVDTLKEILTK